MIRLLRSVNVIFILSATISVSDDAQVFNLMYRDETIYNPKFKSAVTMLAKAFYYDAIMSKGKILDRVLKERIDLDVGGMEFPKITSFMKFLIANFSKCLQLD